MKELKFAVCTVAYNEEDYIGACIDNWKGLVDKHLVLLSSKPWYGSRGESDKTYNIAKKRGADVVVGRWESEAAQRNWGLARLYDYDYVLIVDPDEFYTKADQEKIFKELLNPIRNSYDPERYAPAFQCNKMVTYWKTMDYVLSRDTHRPIIAADPRQLYVNEYRNFWYLEGINRDQLDFYGRLDIICYHMSWVRSDEKILEKINSYSHANIIKPGWYEDIWLKWEPGNQVNVRPYGNDDAIAQYSPAPQEIQDLINNSRKVEKY